MKNIILGLVSVLVLIIAAALIVPSFIDWSQYRDQIKLQVEKSTGYVLDLNGPLRAAFLPSPHVILEDVAIDSANAPGPYAFKASVQNASLSLALLPLLSGDIVVSDITLNKPVANIRAQQVTETEQAEANDAKSQAAEVQSSNGAGSKAVQINNLNLKDADITFKPLDGKAMKVLIPSLQLEADSLTGPFDFEGSVVYNDQTIQFSGESEEYQKVKPFAVDIKLQSNAYAAAYNGIVDMTGEKIAVQGELDTSLSNPQAINLPIKDAVKLSGFLTATPDAAKIDNGVFAVGETKGKLEFQGSDLSTDAKKINASIALASALNLDDILAAQGKAKSAPSGDSGEKSSSSAAASNGLLPDTIELPAGMTGNVAFTAPSVIYKKQQLQNVTARATLHEGRVDGQYKVGALPDGGSVDGTLKVTGESVSRNGSSGSYVLSNPAVAVDGEMNLKSLPTLTVDWLGVAQKDTFNNEAIPTAIAGQYNVAVKGNVASLRFPSLKTKQYNIQNAAVNYAKGSPDKVSVAIDDINGAKVNVAGTVGDTKSFKVAVSHPNAEKAIKIVKPEFQSGSPALQNAMALNADIVMEGSTVNVQNIKAALGTINTTGNVVVDNGSSVPSIKADLNFDVLDTQSLLTGKTSTAAKTGTAGGAGAASASNGSSPWSREAINTDFLRSMNLDLTAKAKRLVHGTWIVENPNIDIDMNGGTLTMNDISGQLFGGSMEMKGKLSAPASGQPLSVDTNISAQNVDLAKLVKAATSQSKDRVLGTGSFVMALKSSGLSSSALVNALNGDGSIKTSELTVLGLDLDKISEAISDESLTDLAAVVRSAFNGGQTVFNPVDEELKIREGTMPINDFRLENDTASVASNGEVSFARWNMNVKSDINIVKPEPLPAMTMTIKGPLNAPQQNVANDLVMSFIKNKYGAKVQKQVDKLLGDKLKDSPVGGMINNLLGLPPKQQQQQPAVNDNTAPAPTEGTTTAPQETETQQAPAQEQAPAERPEEKLIKDLLKSF